ncbi:MAG TPA: hypothetical protein VHE30_18325 [Polyangiaceae bacterium]|nr:hypothetical protein [Polyangiaceae bacterium]
MQSHTQGGTKALTAHGAIRTRAPWAVHFVGVALAGAALTRPCSAHPPYDDYLNPKSPGTRLLLTPFIGPGFRAALDQRFDIEKDMSDADAALVGTLAVPFAEAAVRADFRFFLFTFGGTAGYHDEWHLLRFRPDPETGRDRGGLPPSPEPPAAGLPPGKTPLPPYEDPATTYTDLDRELRQVKDQYADVEHGSWPFAEGRIGFYWPAYGFLGVSTLAARWDGRPDVTYDWENATVQSRGTSFRWETYFLFRERNTGFIGPAFRAYAMPRNRVPVDSTIGRYQVVVPEGSACQMDEAVPCRKRHELEFHYGVVGGICPGWGHGDDALLLRVYTSWGLDERLFGTHPFGQPIQIQVGYEASIPL